MAAGDSPLPSGAVCAGRRRERRGVSDVERYPDRLFVRLSPVDKARAQEVADRLGISLSDLVRSLVRLAATEPDDTARAVAASRPILLDTGCALRMAKELRKWGVHYNQGIHALNTVALRIRHGDQDFSDMLEATERATATLEETEAAARTMRADMAELIGRPALFL